MNHLNLTKTATLFVMTFGLGLAAQPVLAAGTDDGEVTIGVVGQNGNVGEDPVHEIEIPGDDGEQGNVDDGEQGNVDDGDANDDVADAAGEASEHNADSGGTGDQAGENNTGG